MYRIIGADGNEYGPVTTEQIRSWIDEGRANASTKIKLEGMEEWKLLSTFAEFSHLFTTPNPPLDSPPVMLKENYELQIGSCIFRGWNLVKNHFGLTVGITFLWLIIQMILNKFYIGVFLIGVLQGSLYWFYLKLIRQGEAKFADAYAGFTMAFIQLLLLGIIYPILCTIGFFFLVIPGIYLTVVWTFSFFLVMDKNLDFWEAMEASRKMVNKHWWKVFGLLLMNVVLNIFGLCVFLIGIFVTLPVSFASLAYAYEDIFNVKNQELTSQDGLKLK